MKNSPEVNYVRSGYTPMRASLVSPNSQRRARRRSFSRAHALAKQCKEVGNQVAREIARVRVSLLASIEGRK